jgi:hypothetical protein
MLWTIASMRRLQNTMAGNPRYEIAFTNGITLQTAPDSSIAYAIDGDTFQGVLLQLELNTAGQIASATISKENN